MRDMKSAFAEYYRSERNRSESCLGDIIKILADPPAAETDKIKLIIARLIKHYGREEA